MLHNAAAAAAAAAGAILAIFICFHGVSSLNINGDEYIYVNAGWDYVHGDFTANLEHPPVAKYLFGLAQLVGGQGVVAPRVLVGMLVFAGAAIMFVWLRRERGLAAATVAASLWLLSPRQLDGYRIDRVALLEPVMMFFAILAMWLAWRWARRQNGHWAALASGIAMSLSITSKVSSLAILPAFAVLLAIFARGRRALVGAGLFAAGLTATAVAVYVGPRRAGLLYLIQFQSAHNANGHVVWIAGAAYESAPWWAHAWYLWLGVGTPMVVVLAVGVGAAIVRLREPLVLFLASALAGLLVFYLAVAHVALAFYYYAFMPFLVMLAAIGFARLLSTRPAPRIGWRGVSAFALVVLTAVGVIRLAEQTGAIRPTGIAVVPDVLREHDASGSVLVLAITPNAYLPYLGAAGTQDESAGPFSAIVIGTDPRFPPDQALTSALEDEAGLYTLVVEDGVEIWLPPSPVVYGDGSFSTPR
ncbi:ArnT family glycosyltransferase [Microbacterium sp.]|uniref:ArnT family glycosyltransferase n=1 Tax=Microbacterium sp. TaxID=51671 RepID=UPI0039E65648